MFPNNSSVTRPPPSLFPGSGGSPSPAFRRYYQAATTAVVSRPALRSVRALNPAALWLTSLVRSRRPGSPPPARLGVVVRFHPVPVSPQGTYGSHKFPENPIVPLPCSRTPAEPRRLAFAALRCCPPSTERGGPRRPWSFRSSITRPQHWLFTLRAVIADDDAKLASGGWPLFPGWDSSLPTEFYQEVSAFRLPLPLGLLVAISYLLLNSGLGPFTIEEILATFCPVCCPILIGR